MIHASRRVTGHESPKTVRALVALVILCCSLVHAIPRAAAHSWYPQKCCNDQDCFRATAIKRLTDGRLVIQAGHITVIVPSGFPAHPSQDSDPHVCVYRDLRGQYHPRCVFLPGVS